jgi:hypothetical protein
MVAIDMGCLLCGRTALGRREILVCSDGGSEGLCATSDWGGRNNHVARFFVSHCKNICLT